jgi:hypothetical protein
MSVSCKFERSLLSYRIEKLERLKKAGSITDVKFARLRARVVQ